MIDRISHKESLPHAKGIPLGKGCLWHGAMFHRGKSIFTLPEAIFTFPESILHICASLSMPIRPEGIPLGKESFGRASLPQRDAFGMGKDSFGAVK